MVATGYDEPPARRLLLRTEDSISWSSWSPEPGAASQYVVVNESIFGFAGHDSPRTWRSMQAATVGFGGFV